MFGKLVPCIVTTVASQHSGPWLNITFPEHPICRRLYFPKRAATVSPMSHVFAMERWDLCHYPLKHVQAQQCFSTCRNDVQFLTRSHKKGIHREMFRAALLAKTWKQSKCPSAAEWIDQMYYIHTTEYYFGHKKEWSTKNTLKHGWILRINWEARHKRPCIVWFHLYETFRKDTPIVTK